MGINEKIDKVINVVHKIILGFCFFGMAILLIMMLLTTADVVGRSLFNHPITGAFEVTSYMLVIIILLSVAYCEQTNQHVRVDMFVSKFKKTVQFTLKVILTLTAVIFFSLMVWQSSVESLNAMRVKAVSDSLHIPSYPFQFLVAFGSLLMVIELLIKLLTTLVDFSKGEFKKEVSSNDAPIY